MKNVICILLIFICVSTYGQKTKRSRQVRLATITDLKNFKGGSAMFRTKNNHSYKVVFVPDSEIVSSAPVSSCASNDFAGSARKACKISIAKVPVVNMTFAAFIQSLPADAKMRTNPNITSAPNNQRVSEENRNISLKSIFLYGIKRETDNDYHMIIGDKNKTFFNVEISGLPPANSSAYVIISKVRTKVDTYFGKPNCNMGGYMVFPQGINLQLTGSTFYDIDHAPGSVGPQGYTPNTSWEIHPVTDITFLK